jgi:hypothetical protein
MAHAAAFHAAMAAQFAAAAARSGGGGSSACAEGLRAPPELRLAAALALGALVGVLVAKALSV